MPPTSSPGMLGGRSAAARSVSCLAGVLLLAAAASKYQHGWGDRPVVDFLDSDLLAITLVGVELFFGMWFLSGLYPARIRVVGYSLFSFLGVVATALAVGGSRSCACFGERSLPPMAMAGVDAAVAFAFWALPPARNLFAPRPYVPQAMMACMAVAAAVGVAPLAGHRGLFDPRPLAFYPDRVDFGTVEAGSEVMARVTLTNKTPRPRTIALFRSSCSCLEVHPPSVSVPSHGTASLDLRFDTVKQPGATGRVRILISGMDEDGRAICAGEASANVQSLHD